MSGTTQQPPSESPPAKTQASVWDQTVVEAHTRLLYPFFVKPADGQAFDAQAQPAETLIEQMQRTLAACVSRRPRRENQPGPLWTHFRLAGDTLATPPADPPQSAGVRALYREELVKHVLDFLFACQGDDCRCLAVAEELAELWFDDVQLDWKEDLSPKWAQRLGGARGRPVDDIEQREQAGARVLCEVSLSRAANASVEMFLSPFGVGVLSIPLMMRAMRAGISDSPEAPCLLPLCAGDVQTVNYKLSQLRRGKHARLYRPETEWKAQPAAGGDGEAKPAPAPAESPADELPLEARMGVRGKHFELAELPRYLLAPLRRAGLIVEEPQQQFSVYTVVRFDASADFASHQAQAEFGVLLSALAQVEESGHAPAVPGDTVIPSVRLNSKHLAGASPLGAAHLVADQYAPAGKFDLARVQVMRDKYFIAYLLTFFQRLYAQLCKDQAAEIHLRFGKQPIHHHGHTGALASLRQQLFEFAIAAQFTSISTREAVNRFYRTCQKAMGVKQAMAALRQAISDVEAADTARRLEKGVESVAETQHKVEWAEVFIISVYAVELVHHLGESFEFEPAFVGISILVMATATFYVSLKLLAPHETRRITWRGIRMTGVLALVLLAYLIVGSIIKWL